MEFLAQYRDRYWSRLPARTRKVLLDIAAVVVFGGAVVFWSGTKGSGSVWWSLVAALVLVLRRPAPVFALIIVLGIDAFTTTDVRPAMACAAFSVATLDSRRIMIACLAVVGATLLLTPMDGRGREIGFTAVPAGIIGLYVRRSRELTEALHTQEALMTDRSTMMRRAKIAEQIHDVLGHHLSVMVLHAGALELGGGAQEQRARVIRKVGKQALQDLREAIALLQDEEPVAARDIPAGLTAIHELVATSRQAGVPVEATFDPDLRELDPAVAGTVHRVLRESLTNVHKHAGTVPTSVVVRRDGPDRVALEIRNAAPESPPSSTVRVGTGIGLMTLAEKVRMAGGELTHGPTPDGGFSVRATLKT